MWHQVDHPAIQEVPALGFVAVLGNSMAMRFGCSASEVHHLFLDVTSSGSAMCDVMVPHVHQSHDLLL